MRSLANTKSDIFYSKVSCISFPSQSNGDDPWGKGIGAPRYDDSGNLISRFKWSNPNTVQEFKDPTVNVSAIYKIYVNM